MDAGVYLVSGIHDVIQRCVVCNHDERACLFLGHSSACFGYVVDDFAIFTVCALASQYLVDQCSSLRIAHVSVSKPCQEFSDFRLEDDDECNYSDIKDHVEDGLDEPHVEC